MYSERVLFSLTRIQMGPVPEIGKSRREVGATTIGERLITRREKRFVACLAPSEAPVCKGATPGHGALLLAQFFVVVAAAD